MKKEFILFLIASLLMSCLSGINMHTYSKRELVSTKMPGNNSSLKIYYLGGDATMQNCIQVIFNEGLDSFEVIKNYERYNSLNSYSILNGDSLMIVISDTMSYLGKREDTFFLVAK